MNIIKGVTKASLDQHPVWAWTDDEDGYAEIAATSPLPSDRGPLLIKAKLIPSQGPSLDGYVVGLGSVYAVGIFVDDKEFVFNRRLERLSQGVADRLATAIRINPFQLFPLRYVTDFTFSDGSPVRGDFSID
jgi:hypothetical protein